MNLRLTILTLVFGCCIMNAGHHTNTALGQPTTINITLNTANRADLNQINDCNQQANHTAIQKTDVATDVGNNPCLQQQLYDFLHQQSVKAQGASLEIFNWMQHNKIKTTGIGVLLVYSCIALQLYRANMIINDPNSWSSWHHGRSLQDLFATEQSALESDLLFAIQTRYVHPTNPTDFIYSIVESSVSLKHEIQVVQNQIWRYEWLAKCQCLPLFFIDMSELETLKERHRKLLFMQHLFASWCARYKIDKNN
jgi:hypothetical protein